MTNEQMDPNLAHRLRALFGYKLNTTDEDVVAGLELLGLGEAEIADLGQLGDLIGDHFLERARLDESTAPPVPPGPAPTPVFVGAEHDGTHEPTLALFLDETQVQEWCRAINQEEDHPMDENGCVPADERDNFEGHETWATYYILELPAGVVAVRADYLGVVLAFAARFMDDHYLIPAAEDEWLTADAGGTAWAQACPERSRREQAIEQWIVDTLVALEWEDA
jgi:hypothetical protein